MLAMILQQSATFERKSDGAIAIQCSVCFFSGFSTCHCSTPNNSTSSNLKNNEKQKKNSVKDSVKAGPKSAIHKCDEKTASEAAGIASAGENEEARLRLGMRVLKTFRKSRFYFVVELKNGSHYRTFVTTVTTILLSDF